MLEEIGLPYEPHRVRFDANDQKSPACRLARHRWLTGDDYSIADIATLPWVRNLIGFYGAGDLVGIAEYSNVSRALDTFLARPAVIRGLEIPKANPG
jgi:GST-like protein